MATVFARHYFGHGAHHYHCFLFHHLGEQIQQLQQSVWFYWHFADPHVAHIHQFIGLINWLRIECEYTFLKDDGRTKGKVREKQRFLICSFLSNFILPSKFDRMKPVICLLLIALTGLAFIPNADPLPIGSSIPAAAVKMKDVSGKIISLNDVKTNQGLLVMFSCNTCPYVIKNQERTKQTGDYLRQKGIGFVILNSNEGNRSNDESYKAMQHYASAQDYQWPYAVDSNNELADAFGASRTPEVYLFDGKGKLVYRGAMDDSPADPSKISRQHLKLAIDEMLAGKPVSVAESRSVGCGIKRKE